MKSFRFEFSGLKSITTVTINEVKVQNEKI